MFRYRLSRPGSLITAAALVVGTLLVPAQATLARSAPVTESTPAVASAPAAARTAADPVTPNGLAATPPLGWNDWYAFYCNINEKLITETDTDSAIGLPL